MMRERGDGCSSLEYVHRFGFFREKIHVSPSILANPATTVPQSVSSMAVSYLAGIKHFSIVKTNMLESCASRISD